ncbi:MAG TPA: hypothetical protein VL242_40290 [Sorangium sp.]|nr:hypothetical protein [Sorangium sp.]
MSTSDTVYPVMPRLPDGSKAMPVIASGEVPLVAAEPSRLKGREAAGALHLPDEPPALPEPDEPLAPPAPEPSGSSGGWSGSRSPIGSRTMSHPNVVAERATGDHNKESASCENRMIENPPLPGDLSPRAFDHGIVFEQRPTLIMRGA